MAGGRPSKLTPETCKAIVDGITIGMPYHAAAQAAGITYETFNNWMNRGKKAKSGRYFQFFQDIKEAESRGIRNNLILITKAAKEGSWQASAWILERRHPEDFGRREKVNMNADMKHSGGVTVYLPENGR